MRELLSRVIGAVGGGVAAWLATETGADIDVEWLVTGVLAIYGVLHKLIDKKANPSDTASVEKGAKQIEEARPIPRGGPIGKEVPGKIGTGGPSFNPNPDEPRRFRRRQWRQSWKGWTPRKRRLF